MNKKLVLGIAMLLAVAFTACAQTSLSGRYVADDEDSIYSYFEFTNRNTVRIGVSLGGILSSSVTARYEIKNGYVIIDNNDGDVIELEIIDANTLEGDGFLLDGVRFIKRSS
jgi:hypothetical protein